MNIVWYCPKCFNAHCCCGVDYVRTWDFVFDAFKNCRGEKK